MIQRTLQLPELLRQKSHLFLGPRSTGKTTLIEQQLPQAKVYDLLDSSVFRALVKHPKLLGEEATPDQWVVVDEIQKLPELLDEVQRLIQKKKMTFLLTGSSARKIKRGAANLLGGRLWETRLFPLTSHEIPQFDLLTYLNTGGLPHIYGSAQAALEQRNYINLYLKEEIHSESLVRNISSFSECLEIFSLSNGQEINFENFSRDTGIPTSSIKNYISILCDTLLAFTLPPFLKTKKRKAIARSKLYLFDIGIVNYLNNRSEIKPKSELFGQAFEHFVLQELRAYLSYTRSRDSLTYWRSVSQFEVDCIVGKKWALEIKSSELVLPKHLKGLQALKEEGLIKNYGIISLDPHFRKTEQGIHIFPWKMFLDQLWSGKLISE